MKLTAPQPTETGRRFGFPSDPIRIPADQIRSALEWVAQQPNIPEKLSNAMFARVWFLKVSSFRSAEEKLMDSGEYDKNPQDHRAVLAALIAEGEGIVLAAKKTGMEATNLDFTIKDIEAEVESLHATFYCQHRAKNSPEINTMIEGLFDGEKR